MYQMVIADDERIIRQGLKHVVEWEALGFQVTEMFADGQEIIEYLEYMLPDVILTDIRMNHVSGLEAARYVFEHRLPCKVVLVSGYQEFDLAVQGIKYGAEDYLLKPVSVDRIEETFHKVKAQLDALHTERARIQADRDRMEEALPMLEERFFADLILGVADSREYIDSRMSILHPGMDLGRSMCVLADVEICEYDSFMNDVWEYSYDQLEMNLANFLRIYRGDFIYHIVYKDRQLLEIFGIGTAGKAAEGFCSQEEEMQGGRRFCAEGLEALQKELEQSFRFRTRYEIRKIYRSIYDATGSGEPIWSSESKEMNPGSHIQEQKKLVMSNLSVGNIVTAQKLFHSILDELNGLNGPAAGVRNNMVIDILSTMNEVIREVNGKLSESLQSYFNYTAVLTMKNTEEIRSFCDRIFDRIRMAEEKKEPYDAGSLISRAKAYIQENIYRDISQEETANQLFICSSYLSRLFRKQTGENFTQYVTRVKVERAIEMLADPRYKTYQVSEALGYKTPRYFSRLFRQQTGMNPSEYRGKVLHIGDEFDETHE